ncbi:hypothetical protein [Arenimonas daejeonensis]|uniref:hypothetical protein n=1 Tax=Arenimonas daejeonensis TaxID=370777 RepID=UPI0011BF4D51|nr:hypothetical protein [Arenimonas daejeonensis]
MIRSLSLVSLALPALFLASAPVAASTAACNIAALPPMPATVPAPEMQRAVTPPLSCVSLVAYTERLRRPAAPVAATPRPAPAASSPAAYAPKTQHDNTPWRFDMNQNGRRMTAEEFDAWMKAKGIRVATGKPGASAPAAAPAAAAPAQCVASATVQC